jgi:hypothetical protein
MWVSLSKINPLRHWETVVHHGSKLRSDMNHVFFGSLFRQRFQRPFNAKIDRLSQVFFEISFEPEKIPECFLFYVEIHEDVYVGIVSCGSPGVSAE